MLRKLSETFTATHFTILALGAMLVPGALYAVAPNGVVVQDPASPSRQARVEAGGHLSVVDTLGDYAANPANFVNVYFVSNGSCSDSLYEVPAGKALVITKMVTTLAPLYPKRTTSVSLYYNNVPGCLNLIGGATSSGNEVLQVVDPMEPGAVVPAGQFITVYGSNTSFSNGFFRGYLVPANAVPAAGSAEAAMLMGSRKSLPLPGRS